jgi:hypothetical protein
VWTTVLPFAVGVLYFLPFLARETKLKQQIQYVGLIGRLANGSVMVILASLYFELNPDQVAIYQLLIIGTALFNMYAAYIWYKPIIVPALKRGL